MKLATGIALGFLLGAFMVAVAWMYPEPTWKFGRSTAYMWSERSHAAHISSIWTKCNVWIQREQAWHPCTDFDKRVRDSFRVEWSNQSAQMDVGLPPK